MTVLAVSTFVWIFILVPLVVIWILGAWDILRRPLSRGTKAGWLIIVILFPFVGMLAYLLMRKPTDEELRLARAAGEDHPGDQRFKGPHPPID